ncbi:MAG: class I SAM-dependent methyltransferase [Candidatus Omnitrophica bacterium]|nr:class I SAM-dependent methyltransferase [Candidatus Omnitrophota bacterium]
MLQKLYYWFHNITSKPEERGEYSSGKWQEEVRQQALNLSNIEEGALLEVGCGEGLFLIKAAQTHTHLNIRGIDRWQEILDKTQKKIDEGHLENIQLTHADGTHIPFDDSSFDVIVCINVFFNLPTDEIFHQVLQEISRVCKPGGKIIFDIRNSSNPLLNIKYKLAKYYDETVKDLPLRTYSLKEVENLLQKYHWHINKEVPVSFPKNKWSPIFVIEAGKLEDL